MPGNEVGDRVHNFFAEEDLSHGQHHSQVVDENWAVPNNYNWVGSQSQTDVQGSRLKDYSQQQSDLERAHNIHSQQVQHGLYSMPPTRPELTKNLFHNQHPDLNGNIYGHKVFHTMSGEAKFLGVDTESDQNKSIGRGFSVYEQSQHSGPNDPATSVRLNSFESPVSYDFFGGQPQMSDHPGMQQSLPHQQSGFSDMQRLQQQLMFRKMEELQRQKDLQQLHARQQNSVKHMSSFVGHVSGNHSHDFINGTPVSDASQPWATEPPAGNTNWLQRASSAMQGSSSGLMFSPEQGQVSQSLNLINKQVDHSLPGVPISSLRDNSKQYHYIAKDKSLQQMATYSNSYQGNQYAAFREQASMQDEHVISRQGFQEKKLFGHTSHQGLNSMLNLKNSEQLNPLEKNVATQEFHGKQEIGCPSRMLQDKIIGQMDSSQNPVALDPTEEKILFGSDDDGVWDAFGKNTITNGGVSNLFDSTEFVDGLPSIQSGSWSALMQSAVAETSSSDVVLREEWTNLSFQNPDRPTGKNQSSTYDTDKRHTPLVDNNLQIPSAFTFGSVPVSHDTNQKNSYPSAQGLLQFGQKVSGGYVEGMQNNSSHRPIQQSPSKGSNWLNGGSQNIGTANHSVDADMNGKGISSHWNRQQNGSSQPSKLHSWTVTKGVTPSADTALGIHENENYMQDSQNNGQKRVMHELLNHKDGTWKVNSVSNLAVDLEQLRSTTAQPQEGSSLNTDAARLNSSKSRVSEEASYLNSWKPIEVSMKTKESEHSRKAEHLLNKGHQLVQSPFHSYEEVKMREMGSSNRKENHKDSYQSSLSDRKFTTGSRGNNLSDSSDSQSVAGGKHKSSNQVGRKTAGPRKFQYHPMGNLDEDVDPSYQMKQDNHSKLMPLHNSQGFKSQDKGFFGQSKFFGQIPKDSSDKGKGQLPDHQGGTNRSDEVSSRGGLPGYGLDLSSDLNRSFGMSRVNLASHSSENMLELLHKVDQSEEHSSAMRISTGYSPSSQTPEVENSDGIVGSLRQNQSSASQGFGLQLAPPSQKGPGLNHVSPNPSQTVKFSSSVQATSDGENRGQKMLDPTTLCRSSFPREVCQGEFKNNRNFIPGQTASDASLHKMHEKISSESGFPYSRSELQNQPMSKSSGQVLVDSHSRLGSQSAGNSVRDAAGGSSHDEAASSVNISRRTPMDHAHYRASAAQISAGEVSSVSQTISRTGISQKGAFPNMLSTIRPKVAAQQQYTGPQDCRGQPKNFQSHRLDIVESTVFAPKNLEDQGPKLMDNSPSDLGVGSLHPQGFVCGNEQLGKEDSCQQVSSGNKDLGQKINESLRKEPVIQQISCAPSANPPSTKRDMEAFGRSLKPNNFIQQNFSLQNQIKAMKNLETDPSNRDSKRVKGPSNILLSEQVASKSGQQYNGGAMVEDSPPSCSVPSVDPKMRCFPEPVDYGGINASSSQTTKVPCQDMLALDRNKSESFQHGSCTASVRTEHPNISPQMAPSWFNQYGSFKNGQILQVYDARKSVALNTMDQPSMFGQSLNNLHMQTSVEHMNIAADPNQISYKLQNTPPALLAVEHLSSPQLLQPDNACENLVVSMPKKRKCTTFEPQSWQKGISKGSTDLQSLRVAEANWAKETRRLSEKVEDDFDTEYGFAMPRARRRLSLTKQLMQLLFPAPSAVILSAEASLNYETVAYFVARLALGDACSLISCLRSHSDPSDGANLQADKRKTSDRNSELHTSRVMEDFTGIVRNLETDLLRLDKNPPLLDLRLEVQDIEKISTVNRFAMFHSRLQTDGAETSSRPGAAVGSQKPFPQRYVTAVALPKNLPDRVQCLSL